MRGAPWGTLAALTLALGLASTSVGADEERSEWGTGTIALLPLANNTEVGEALVRVEARIRDELTRRGVPTVAEDSLRRILRRHRIRTSGRIGLEGAQVIARETGAGLLFLGSVDIYATEGVPELAISARLVRPDDRTVIHAASVAATGRDFPALFHGDRVLAREPVMEWVIARLFDQLDTSRQRPLPEGRTVVVVPFDNASDHGGAGGIVTTVLVSRLVARGYRVVEPGESRELSLREAELSAGGADYRLLDAVSAAYGPTLVVTGTVEHFRPASGPVGQRIPSVEITARAIDAGSRRVAIAFGEARRGDDSEGLFQSGRRNSVVRLTARILDTFVDRLDEERGRRHER